MAIGKKTVTKELLDGVLADNRKSEDLIGENVLSKKLTKLLPKQALQAPYRGFCWQSTRPVNTVPLLWWLMGGLTGGSRADSPSF